MTPLKEKEKGKLGLYPLLSAKGSSRSMVGGDPRRHDMQHIEEEGRMIVIVCNIDLCTYVVGDRHTAH